MFRKIAILSLLFLVCACSSEDEKIKIPENIIPPEQMVPIIVDFHLVEASLVQANQRHEDLNQITNYRYTSVLKKHKVNRKQLAESLIFYTDNIKELESIYTKVVEELSTTQGRIISK
jgi:hypothetical protein